MAGLAMTRLRGAIREIEQLFETSVTVFHNQSRIKEATLAASLGGLALRLTGYGPSAANLWFRAASRVRTQHNLIDR